MNADGSALKLLGTEAANPSWSADGRRLAVERGADVWTVGVDGGNPRRLTRKGGSEPAWSSDNRIAFSRQTRHSGFPGLDFDVFVIGATGGRARRLTYKGGASPDWSPHATKVAFVRRSDVYMVSSSGRRLRRFTRGQAAAPVWSPNGRLIAFIHPVFADDGNQGIYVKQTDGGRLRKVGPGVPSGWQPLR